MQELKFEELDSFILKHRINYDTKIDSTNDSPQRMLFIDYDLARKSQPTNAENFATIYDSTNVLNMTSIEFNYYDDTYTILLDGESQYTDQFNNTNVIDNINDNIQEYYIDNIDDFNIGDIIEINLFQSFNITGDTTWSHNGLAGETWYVSGYTENITQWEAIGTTTINGYSNGTTTWSVDEKTTTLTYNAEILDIIGDNIIVDRTIKKHTYNNLLSTDNLFYEIITLNHANKEVYNIKEKIDKSPYGNYISTDIITQPYTFIFNPIRNRDDIYFDYDVFNITFNTQTANTYYFITEMIYNRYNLSDFFEQLSISDQTEVMISEPSVNTYFKYIGQPTLYLTFPSSTDLDMYHDYLYVNVHTNVTDHISLITNTNNNIFTIEVPNTMDIGETVLSISNISKIVDISNILTKCYLNVDDSYFIKRDKPILDNIYFSYARVFNLNPLNATLRKSLSGLLFENINNIMTLKIYDPTNVEDNDPRITYKPYEMININKDRKTSIPVQIYADPVRVIPENPYVIYGNKNVGAMFPAGTLRPVASTSLIETGTVTDVNGQFDFNIQTGNYFNYIWFAVPIIFPTSIKNYWYVDILNNSEIGGDVSLKGNLFPDPTVVSYKGLDYYVYIANYQTGRNATELPMLIKNAI